MPAGYTMLHDSASGGICGGPISWCQAGVRPEHPGALLARRSSERGGAIPGGESKHLS